MEVSIQGGVSAGQFPLIFLNFFCSPWPKNHFQPMMFFLVCGGVSPLRHLKPLLSWKNHVTAKIVCVAANILHVVANISRVVADKAVEEAKNCWPMNFFFHFLGNFNGENTLFPKSVQKMV